MEELWRVLLDFVLGYATTTTEIEDLAALLPDPVSAGNAAVEA
jgi:hypothetical protein